MPSNSLEGSKGEGLLPLHPCVDYMYLSQDARDKLPVYEYRGGDLSLTYNYILSPLAAWCVDTFVPKSVAPNSITMFGLVLMLTAYGIYWYYVPSCEMEDPENVPRWIFLWNGIAMLCYQTLDNMDGKQARRTGSSSALGLLFDHGCDAINSIFGSVNWIIGMALVPNENLLECWALVFGPYAMFYVATWEQYHTGELILPAVNGPNEGLLGGALLSITSWYYGPSFWQGIEWYRALQMYLPLPSSLSLRNCDIVIWAASIGFVQEMLLKSISVGRKHPETFATILPIVVLTTCFFLVGYWEPEVLLSYPRTALHMSMLLFVEMSTELMLCHVTGQPFHPFRRWPLVPLVALSLWIYVVGSNDSLGYWLVSYTAGLAVYLSFKIVSVIREMCHTLQIWCFDIMTPYPNGSSHITRLTKQE